MRTFCFSFSVLYICLKFTALHWIIARIITVVIAYVVQQAIEVMHMFMFLAQIQRCSNVLSRNKDTIKYGRALMFGYL